MMPATAYACGDCGATSFRLHTNDPTGMVTVTCTCCRREEVRDTVMEVLAAISVASDAEDADQLYDAFLRAKREEDV